jgi:hypothetical protein
VTTRVAVIAFASNHHGRCSLRLSPAVDFEVGRST